MRRLASLAMLLLVSRGSLGSFTTVTSRATLRSQPGLRARQGGCRGWRAAWPLQCARRAPFARQTALLSSMRAGSVNSGGPDQRELLVLAFDINKTIVAFDAAAGKSMEQVISTAFADRSRGVVRNGEWANVEDGAALDGGGPGGAPVVSYSQFLDDTIPDVEVGDNKAAKKARDELKGKFVQAGQPGHYLHDDYLRTIAALQLPPAVKAHPAARDAGLASRKAYFIIPAFFRLLERMTISGTPFRLQFRTFGTDLPRVIDEFNAFCEGRHPLSTGIKLDGTCGDVDYRIHWHQLRGVFHRDSSGSIDLYVGCDDFENKEDCHPPLHGIRAIQSWQRVMYSEMRTKDGNHYGSLALRDFWPYWRDRLEAPEAGKLLILEDENVTKYRMRTIFIDDNVGLEDAHIVDVRKADGSCVPFREAKQTCLIRADIIKAIQDPKNYFMDEIRKLGINIK